MHSVRDLNRIKPRSLTKVSQSLQEQLSVVHFLILDLKTDNGDGFLFHLVQVSINKVLI